MATVTTCQYAQEMIDKYKRRIENLKWHLQTNASFVTPEERQRITERIYDFEDVIRDFKPLCL